jgi:aminopeptidase-like protein
MHAELNTRRAVPPHTIAGKWKLRTVFAALNKRGEIVLRIKKTNLVVMAFSQAKESKYSILLNCYLHCFKLHFDHSFY